MSQQINQAESQWESHRLRGLSPNHLLTPLTVPIPLTPATSLPNSLRVNPPIPYIINNDITNFNISTIPDQISHVSLQHQSPTTIHPSDTSSSQLNSTTTQDSVHYFTKHFISFTHSCDFETIVEINITIQS